MSLYDNIEDMKKQIAELKKEKDAVILAHYYVMPEIQEIADYIGDSFFLSKKATDRKNTGENFFGFSPVVCIGDKDEKMGIFIRTKCYDHYLFLPNGNQGRKYGYRN